MNIKEIMMDYYVRLNKDAIPLEKGEILKVVSITLRQFRKPTATCKDIKGEVFYVYVADLSPIPLTVDFLKDNGFEMASSEIQAYMLWEHKYTVFAKKIDNEAWQIDIFSKECKLPYQSSIVYHVHQLQQWLRFCGIEREIKMSLLTSINTI